MIMEMIAKIERERALNTMLLERLLEGLDNDIQALEQKKADLREEFSERDASLLRLIEGNPHPVAVPKPAPEADAA